uniref:Uncharacterized protein n=1 Tax=Brassica oleracea var. oleracea TaxID=109376 RepID=A0A0D3ANW9_BRAOL
MVLIFHSFKDLEDFWDDLHVSRLKYNALDDFQEVFQTTSISVVWTSWKSSGLHRSLLTKSPFPNRSERFGFSDLDLICMIFRSGRLLGRLTYDFQVSRLQPDDFPSHIRLLQAHRISNGSDPPRIFTRMKKEEGWPDFGSIKSFKLAVHGGWGIDDNDNLVEGGDDGKCWSRGGEAIKAPIMTTEKLDEWLRDSVVEIKAEEYVLKDSIVCMGNQEPMVSCLSISLNIRFRDEPLTSKSHMMKPLQIEQLMDQQVVNLYSLRRVAKGCISSVNIL